MIVAGVEAALGAGKFGDVFGVAARAGVNDSCASGVFEEVAQE